VVFLIALALIFTVAGLKAQLHWTTFRAERTFRNAVQTQRAASSNFYNSVVSGVIAFLTVRWDSAPRPAALPALRVRPPRHADASPGVRTGSLTHMDAP
jgi:hypothetical protein